jgi:hypothetical protein
MRKLFVTTMVLLLALPAFSQVKFGIKAGASTTTVPTYEATGTGSNIEALEDAAWGLHAGIFLRFGLGPVYLQPEVVFNSNTYEYRVQTATASEILDQRFNRLEIPLLLGIKLGPLRINAGPSATVPIGSPDALIDDPNFEDMFRGTTFGYQAGVGVDIFNTITLDARYGGSLSEEFGSTATIGNSTFRLDSRQPQFILSLGIMF